MLHSDSLTVGWWPTKNKQAELVGKGGELSKEQGRAQVLAGKLTMWTAAGAASGKVLTPSCARGKGGLTPSEGVRPQFCKARCSLYEDAQLQAGSSLPRIIHASTCDVVMMRMLCGSTISQCVAHKIS